MKKKEFVQFTKELSESIKCVERVLLKHDCKIHTEAYGYKAEKGIIVIQWVVNK